MIQVGKVITEPSVYRGDHQPPTCEKSISVSMNSICISIDSKSITPQQAIDLAQLLMKAAECQVEYSKAAKELEDQKDKLNAKYKDMISGLGLENPDLKASDLTKQAWSGVTSR